MGKFTSSLFSAKNFKLVESGKVDIKGGLKAAIWNKLGLVLVFAN